MLQEVVQVSLVGFHAVLVNRNSSQERQLALRRNKVEGGFSDAQKRKHKCPSC